MASQGFILALLFTLCFTLGTWLEGRRATWGTSRTQGDELLTFLLGDGRRLFANHFFAKADIYFHGGYYPSIFDQGRPSKERPWLVQSENEHETSEHEKEMDFLGPPRDWIERIGRHFYITEHTHLHGGSAREILPWLRLAAALEPERVETYTVAAYWLRKELGKAQEAEQFLREGLRANPDSSEILLELGRLYNENFGDSVRARNVCELALRKWHQQSTKPDPDWLLYREITAYLAHLEEKAGRLEEAVHYLEKLKKASPVPEAIQKQIDNLKQRLKAPVQSATP